MYASSKHPGGFVRLHRLGLNLRCSISNKIVRAGSLFCLLFIFVHTCMLSTNAVGWLKECIAGMT